MVDSTEEYLGKGRVGPLGADRSRGRGLQWVTDGDPPTLPTAAVTTRRVRRRYPSNLGAP